MRNLIFLLFAGLLFGATACVKTAQLDENKTLHLTFDTIRITQGITQYLAAKDFSAAEISWRSADTTVAKIDDRGVVNGINPGQTLITATSIKYKSSAKCVVIVTANKLSEMKVSDVGVGADGSIFTIGTDVVSPTGGFGIYQLKQASFAKLEYCAGTRIAVAPNGKPWVVNKSKLIFRYRDAASPWEELPGMANDIGIGADGSVFVVSNTAFNNGYKVMKWNDGFYSWMSLPDVSAVRIAVDANGLPWVVTFTNQVLRYDGSAWKSAGIVLASDIGIGKDGSVFITGIDAKSSVYKLDRQTNLWTLQQGKYGVSISVTPNGEPVYIDPLGYLYK